MMRRGDGRYLLAPLAVGVLLFSACSSGDDPTAADEPVPQPTAIIEDAPTATAAPEPTATPEPAPTATPEPEPTAAESVEDQVIAAWERYLELSIEARGKEPTPGARRYGTFVGGLALERLEEVLLEQDAAGEYVRGVAVSLTPRLDFEHEKSVLVTDCVNVSLERVDAETDAVKSSQADDRGTRARMELIGGGWIVTGVETGPTCE